MFELPRACLKAGAIAAHADFFSFGTNDLTQTGLGFSRDDIEGRIMPLYANLGIVERSPFGGDTEGMGELVEIALERGRAAKPGLQAGVCGEHGGDPSSIGFFHAAGLDYVSCSPFRVPIARVAAAQAAVAEIRTSGRVRTRPRTDVRGDGNGPAFVPGRRCDLATTSTPVPGCQLGEPRTAQRGSSSLRCGRRWPSG